VPVVVHGASSPVHVTPASLPAQIPPSAAQSEPLSVVPVHCTSLVGLAQVAGALVEQMPVPAHVASVAESTEQPSPFNAQTKAPTLIDPEQRTALLPMHTTAEPFPVHAAGADAPPRHASIAAQFVAASMQPHAAGRSG
jgi:hypothetical protein